MTEQAEYLKQIIAFINETEKLKDVYRSGYTSGGKQESTAEHTWRLALLVLMLTEEFPQCDPVKLLSLSLVHDLGELDHGDIPAVVEVDPERKESEERQTIHRLSGLLPEAKGRWLTALWQEYDEGITQEAKVVKALDKMETILQHNLGDNPADFDYGFNLAYGKTYAEGDRILETVREMVDGMTRMRMNDVQNTIECTGND